ncbi:MAG: class I SAM-dependent methyltransferase [Steroidobacteraceae bacterium]
MAHYQQLEFVRTVKRLFPEYFRKTRVLEVGSWDVNGSVRGVFAECDYVGADIAAGSGVDLTCAGQDIGFPSGHFDVVISCECFEHNPYWLETTVNMMRMLRPGGCFIMSCGAPGRREHGTPRMSPGASLTSLSGQVATYYRNLSQRDFFARIDLGRHFSRFFFSKNIYSKDLYLFGIKASPVEDPGVQSRVLDLKALVDAITVEGGPGLLKRLKAPVSWWSKQLLVKVLGERGYHEVKYRLRSLIARRS